MTKSHFQHLSDRWKARRQNLRQKLLNKHGESLDWLSNNYKQLVAGSLGGLMMITGHITNPEPFLPQAHSAGSGSLASESEVGVHSRVFLISDLANVLPKEVRELSQDEEQKVSEILSRNFGLKVTPEVEGKRLNRNYGFIGAEQHLARYPGETLSSHFDLPAGGEENMKLYWQQGMAPGLGAWRYFATSKDAMTKQDIDREKYYIAVQTFLSKDFQKRFSEYRDFYKYRKMLVVNPNNGKAIVTDIGDAGPGESTGKHLGGSPEVMHYLQRFDGRQKGPVLYFFIDDPDDKIKLGPVQVLS